MRICKCSDSGSNTCGRWMYQATGIIPKGTSLRTRNTDAVTMKTINMKTQLWAHTKCHGSLADAGLSSQHRDLLTHDSEVTSFVQAHAPWLFHSSSTVKLASQFTGHVRKKKRNPITVWTLTRQISQLWKSGTSWSAAVDLTLVLFTFILYTNHKHTCTPYNQSKVLDSEINPLSCRHLHTVITEPTGHWHVSKQTIRFKRLCSSDYVSLLLDSPYVIILLPLSTELM
jgi:hypothetical protein